MIHYEYSLTWALAQFILGQFISYTSYQRQFIQDFFYQKLLYLRDILYHNILCGLPEDLMQYLVWHVAY